MAISLLGRALSAPVKRDPFAADRALFARVRPTCPSCGQAESVWFIFRRRGELARDAYGHPLVCCHAFDCGYADPWPLTDTPS